VRLWIARRITNGHTVSTGLSTVDRIHTLLLGCTGGTGIGGRKTYLRRIGIVPFIRLELNVVGAVGNHLKLKGVLEHRRVHRFLVDHLTVPVIDRQQALDVVAFKSRPDAILYKGHSRLKVFHLLAVRLIAVTDVQIIIHHHNGRQRARPATKIVCIHVGVGTAAS
jgi:hypothetical protein